MHERPPGGTVLLAEPGTGRAIEGRDRQLLARSLAVSAVAFVALAVRTKRRS